jgi:hypothetical protein
LNDGSADDAAAAVVCACCSFSRFLRCRSCLRRFSCN